ncbi:hypothetical protein BDZ89DRAFT_1054409 [Hymenopellis radicata]|nr:hypothetical protein BDZ89DRAFT_1054409 [Hymenopellis radicata]
MTIPSTSSDKTRPTELHARGVDYVQRRTRHDHYGTKERNTTNKERGTNHEERAATHENLTNEEQATTDQRGTYEDRRTERGPGYESKSRTMKTQPAAIQINDDQVTNEDKQQATTNEERTTTTATREDEDQATPARNEPQFTDDQQTQSMDDQRGSSPATKILDYSSTIDKEVEYKDYVYINSCFESMPYTCPPLASQYQHHRSGNPDSSKVRYISMKKAVRGVTDSEE